MLKKIIFIVTLNVLASFFVAPVFGTQVEDISQEMIASLESANGPSMKIVSVNGKFNFVVINQGLQSGYKVGDLIKVFRDGKAKGAVRIEELYNKFSIAAIIEEDPQFPMAEGDEVKKN